MAESMKITAPDLLRFGIVDRVIPGEPAGGAHSDPDTAIASAGDAIEEELTKLSALTPDQLKQQRAERFYAIGRVGMLFSSPHLWERQGGAARPRGVESFFVRYRAPLSQPLPERGERPRLLDLASVR